ncbi:Uu.00g029800.m01.CDS01 [Anthostomella pinea]|uniref:Uu.00g029800.m01.CDS01 n=1 Tax=Anthostomella pinea TaxID=933095 RepID=A0AAI8V8S6_9PEZI|nr:Uu.00g029800.m01.CDS01 [Anthostomella pinea]
MSKISILIIPGAFGLPELHDPVVRPIADQGHDIRALHMETAGLGSGGARDGHKAPDMYADAALIAREVEVLADAGREIIIVAHSYGGVPMTESTRGLRVAERKKQGKPGGIVRIAYLTALVPAVGMTGAEALTGAAQEDPGRPSTSIDENGWLYYVEFSKEASKSFSDLPAEEGERMVRRFTRQSAAAFGSPLTHAGYNDVPVSYLICENDRVIPAESQRTGIKRIEEASGKKVDITCIDAGHVPISSSPQLVINWIG